MYLWKGQWNYVSYGEILQTSLYRGHVTYVSVLVELCQY